MTSSRDLGVRRLNMLLKRAREPVFLLDAERTLVYVNPAWEALTGQTADVVLGLECLPHGPTRDGDLASLGGSFCPPPEAFEGRPAGGKTLIVLPGGERRWCRVEYWPYHDNQGTPIGTIGLVRPPDAPPHAPDSESQHLRAELLEVRERLQNRYGFDTLIGQGPAHRRLLDQVRAAALANVPVLIVGEPGTGKRTIARTIHQQGPNPRTSLVPFDCAALSPEVIERELFGPDGDRPDAKLNLPEGATVLLVDVFELPRDLQARLASTWIGPNRLLATASVDPLQARREGRLRPDLYYVLTTLVIPLDPLRERLAELPLLAQAFLERANLRNTPRRQGFTAEALSALASYDWPGNLRELARVINAAHAQGQGDLIAAADVPATIRGHLGSAYTPPPVPPVITPLDNLLEQLERRLIEQALQRARQNKSKAADLLAISRPRLYRRIKELNIPDESEPPDEPAAPPFGRP
ncbi:MAG: sigma 54-interacting transcriptional regulator [Isosphaeraceae bacterium]